MSKHLATCEMRPPVSPRVKPDLGRQYKALCDETDSRVMNSVLMPLTKTRRLRFDMDSLDKDLEPGMLHFLGTCPLMLKVSLWSSLVKLEDVQALQQSGKAEDANLLHASILSFNERIHKFKKENPNAPIGANARCPGPLSLDSYSNERLVKAVSLNLTKSKVLTELTICGINMSLTAAEQLNEGLMKARSLKKLTINFSVNRRELLVLLMPSLTNPEILPI